MASDKTVANGRVQEQEILDVLKKIDEIEDVKEHLLTVKSENM